MKADQLIGWISNEFNKSIGNYPGQILITAGAGDIDRLIDPIQKTIKEKSS